MHADLVLLPDHLTPRHLQDRTVIVFDVLRATTSMAAALAAGVREIRIFPDLDAARSGAAGHRGAKLLCGERNCLPPAGFDLGNSPGSFGPLHSGRVLFMSTTNGTRAIAAARGAPLVLVGALVNAAAVAHQVHLAGRDVTLLCAGTDGQAAYEDVLGAGAVIEALMAVDSLELTDLSTMALRLFHQARAELEDAMTQAQGGRNVIRAGLAEDIRFCARLSVMEVVGRVLAEPLRVVMT